jgi:dipeptidyl aminopeptidase/acylaminoacyl peptidase
VENRPGTSALHCVLAAARAAVAAGVVDSTRVGLTGHSWGGYQSAFISTQTSFFKAILPGASLTDLISLYGGIYWSTGTAEMDIHESDQTRMTGPYWKDMAGYIRESPVFHVEKVTTPILLLHNDRDDAVDWHQGIEFYNALRRAEKPVVMLQYVGEGHGVAGAGNRKDYARRAREFFDHFLLGTPAPEWWTKGVPFREMERHLRDRQGAAASGGMEP